ncbi:MAG: LysR family transcriptional regulator [Candidatus Thiodiazotropha sp. L084R]
MYYINFLHVNIIITMDLQLLRSLIAVADTGTITEAADHIGLTQPALSRPLPPTPATRRSPGCGAFFTRQKRCPVD